MPFLKVSVAWKHAVMKSLDMKMRTNVKYRRFLEWDQSRFNKRGIGKI